MGLVFFLKKLNRFKHLKYLESTLDTSKLKLLISRDIKKHHENNNKEVFYERFLMLDTS